MTVTSALLSFAVVAALMTMTPGLDTAIVLRSALLQSRLHAAATALGVGGGVLVWGIGAAVGVSALLTASTLAYTVVKVAGAAYMIWMGLGLLRRALSGDLGQHGQAPLTAGSPWRSLRKGFLTNLLNPKIGAFYVAVLPGFMPTGVDHVLMGAALAVVHNLEGMLWFAIIILAAGRMQHLLTRPSAERSIDGVTGTVLIGLGAKLGLSH